MAKLKDALIAYKEDHQDTTWADMADAIGVSFARLGRRMRRARRDD